MERPGLRQRVAAAALDGAGRAPPGSRAQRALAAGFAASAHSESQLGLLRCWLSGTSLSDGVPADLELRGQILATLSARGLAGDDDLDALAAADPVGGEAQRSTCRALRPDSAAKEAAWTAALDGGQSPRDMPSTIIDLTSDDGSWRLLRQGAIPSEQIVELLGRE